MVSATNNLQPAQLSDLAQNLIQIAVDCLDQDSSDISLRSLDAFIEHEMKPQVSELREILSCRYSKNNVYARVYKVLLEHSKYFIPSSEDFESLEAVSLAEQKEKLEEIGGSALDLLKNVLGHLAPANNFDLAQCGDNNHTKLCYIRK